MRREDRVHRESQELLRITGVWQLQPRLTSLFPCSNNKIGKKPLNQVNQELTRSLKLCHSLLDDYRHKLAANSNDLGPAND